MSLKSDATRWARHHSSAAWQYLLNFGPTVSFRVARLRLSKVEQHVVDTLDRDGVATSRDSQVQEWFVRDDKTVVTEPKLAFAVSGGRSGPAWVPRRRP